MPPHTLHWQPAPDAWSVHMVLAHLLNCEPHFQRRLAQIVSEQNPHLPAFSPLHAPPKSDLTFPHLLTTFEFTRQQTLAQIYTYTAADWQRPAVHEHTGHTTLTEQLVVIVNHDVAHIGQLYDLRELWLSRSQPSANRKISGT